MNYYEQIDAINKKLLETRSFDINTLYSTYDGYYVETYHNFLIAEPLTAEAERELVANPYIRLLKFPNHIYAIFYFPENIHDKAEREENLKKMPQKYVTRYYNLIKAKKMVL